MYIDSGAAFEIYYYMIAVDGEVKQSEMEKYMAIMKEALREEDDYYSEQEFEEMFREGKGELDELIDGQIAEWNQRLEQAIDEDDYFEIIKERVDELIEDSVQEWASDNSIEVSGLIWNLLSIATSDKEYLAIEQKLIKYMVRKLNVDKDVYLEMENAMKAIQDVNREVEWLKMSNRPYGVVESMVKEMSERQKVIFDSVKALITDNGEV